VAASSVAPIASAMGAPCVLAPHSPIAPRERVVIPLEALSFRDDGRAAGTRRPDRDLLPDPGRGRRRRQGEGRRVHPRRFGPRRRTRDAARGTPAGLRGGGGRGGSGGGGVGAGGLSPREEAGARQEARCGEEAGGGEEAHVDRPKEHEPQEEGCVVAPQPSSA